jgi:serine/threonine-protein kinase
MILITLTSMEFWEQEYTLLKQLSRENSKRFGTTSLLENKTTKVKVVLKMVKTNNEIGLQQLQNESLFDFSTAGLPKILKTHLTTDSYFILKRFEEGKTLSDYWSTIKRINRLETLKKLVQSLAPLFNQLEKEKIVHGDIKPENILVHTNENTISCSLIDFGLAFKQKEQPIRKTLFQLAYAPPEIILNRLDCANSSSDIFSLCLVIYKLWTGSFPFTESNPALMTQLQITYPIEKPWKMNKKVWKVLERGLHKHSFKQAPNRMTKEQIQIALKNAIQMRYTNFSEFVAQVDQL